MKKRKVLFTALIVALAACVSVSLVCSWSERQLLKKPENEIYEEMKKLSAGKLIRKINRLETKYPDMEDKTELLPLYQALIDKADEFSDEQLIDLIQKRDTLAGIEEALIEMYAANGYDGTKLIVLLDDPDIADETKSNIVSRLDYSVDELCDIFRKFDDRTAVIAMQKLNMADSGKALQLVDELLASDQGGTELSFGKYKAICLGIANYYEKSSSSEEAAEIRAEYAPVLKKIYHQSSSGLVQDQAVYALGRICDYELFSWIIEHDQIDFQLKVSVIERNTELMKMQIASAKSEDDIRAVMKAMNLHPVYALAAPLQKAVEQGNLPASEELLELIDHIQKEGIGFHG